MAASIRRPDQWLRRLPGIALLTVAAVSSLFVSAEPAGAAVPGAGYHFIKEFNSLTPGLTPMCLDVKDANPRPGATLQRWDCGTQWNQQFLFAEPSTLTGELSYKLKPRYTEYARLNMCVQVRGGTHATDAPLELATCGIGWEQRFVVVPWPNFPGTYSLRSAYMRPPYVGVNDQRCLEFYGNYLQHGWAAAMQQCDGYSPQYFSS